LIDKAAHTRNLRYKRPALDSMGYETIINELYEINDACGEIQWFVDGDKETLLNALDGDDEAEYEFRMAFSSLQGKAETLQYAISDWDIRETFDHCTVALIGNRYTTIGYDSVEEDYFSLTSYDQELAHTESGKKLMRMTKQEMISTIGQCMGITLAFIDLRQSYDYLKATFDILRDENTSVLKIIKEIDDAYKQADNDGFSSYRDSTRRLDMLLNNLPDRAWLEC
jgi:hypothetical protein